MHTITLKKWGNSVGLLLPASVAREIHFTSGTKVELDVSDRMLVIRKAAGQSKIEELCAQIAPENLHSETEWGDPQGKEVW